MARKVSLGVFFLQIALALFLLFSGLNATSAVVKSDSFGFSATISRNFGDNEVVTIVDQLLPKNKSLATFIIIILAIVQIACGAILLLNFFIETKQITDILLIIMLVVWALIIIFLDIIGTGGLINGAFKNYKTFVAFCKQLSQHLLVIGAILLAFKNE
ncbi:MAG: hypothetical protein QM387_03220 [Spirochaetota bacterium]|nr:hypothetical protein [Spirochaetota bacterium]